MMKAPRLPCGVEIHGDGALGALHRCDLALGAPPALLDAYAGRVQLVYADPPLLSGEALYYRQPVGAAGWQGDAGSVLKQDAGRNMDMRCLAQYLRLMRRAIELAHALLKDEGCIYMHADFRAAAQVRLLLDEVFGPENFVNQIIWHYKSGGRPRNVYARRHDTILFYRKSARMYFNLDAVGAPRGEQRRSHLKRAVDERGRTVYTIRVGEKTYTYSPDDLVYPGDVWDDIPALNQRDGQRTGYDGQKPRALLERMIRASSRLGDIVCDLFMGSGTGVAVASANARGFLGLDNSPLALRVARRRLIEEGARDMLIDLGAPEPGDDAAFKAPWISLERAGSAAVWLRDYRIPGIRPGEGALTLIPDLPAVDGWATGLLRQGAFYALHITQRTRKRPYIEQELPWPLGEGVPCALVCDVEGRRVYVPLEAACGP